LKDFKIKIKALFLAIIVLFSSSFIVIDSHYCCGVKTGTTLFGKAKDCGMLTKACILDPNKLSYSEDSCCENSVQFKQGSEFNNYSGINTTLQQVLFLPTFYTTVLSSYTSIHKIKNYYKDYVPPLLSKDILILVQNFRL
jgi:hypothetical protein